MNIRTSKPYSRCIDCQWKRSEYERNIYRIKKAEGFSDPREWKEIDVDTSNMPLIEVKDHLTEDSIFYEFAKYNYENKTQHKSVCIRMDIPLLYGIKLHIFSVCDINPFFKKIIGDAKGIIMRRAGCDVFKNFNVYGEGLRNVRFRTDVVDAEFEEVDANTWSVEYIIDTPFTEKILMIDCDDLEKLRIKADCIVCKTGDDLWAGSNKYTTTWGDRRVWFSGGGIIEPNFGVYPV